MDLPPPPPPKSSSSPSPFGLVSVCGLLTELEDVGRVVALAGYGHEARRLPFLCTSLARDEELLAATRDAVYGGLRRTRLMYAARVGAVRRVQVLLRLRGAVVDARDTEGCTALHHASAAGQTESARLLLKAGADVEADDKRHWYPWRPLHYASVMGHEGTARLLLQLDADPKYYEDEIIEEEETEWERHEAEEYWKGYHPLHLACIHGHVGVVKILLDAGADEGHIDSNSCTPFIRAVRIGQEAVVRLLIDHGQDVDGRKSDGHFASWCSLFVAASKGRESMIRLLVEKGADVNLRMSIGTPLHGAVYGASLPATRLLLELGADPTIRSSFDGDLTPEQLVVLEIEQTGHLQGLSLRERQQGWAEIAAFYAALPRAAAEEQGDGAGDIFG
jgi:ankyrin repeat protein